MPVEAVEQRVLGRCEPLLERGRACALRDDPVRAAYRRLEPLDVVCRVDVLVLKCDEVRILVVELRIDRRPAFPQFCELRLGRVESPTLGEDGRDRRRAARASVEDSSE